MRRRAVVAAAVENEMASTEAASSSSSSSSPGAGEKIGLPHAYIKPREWTSKVTLHEDFAAAVDAAYCSVAQQPESVIEGAVARLTEAARECIAPSAKVHPFGSTVNGFGAVSSDLDVLVEVDEPDLYYYMSFVNWHKREQKWNDQSGQARGSQAKSWPRLVSIHGKKARTEAVCQLRECLPQHGFRVLKALPKARKPLLTVADVESNLSEIDVSINNLLPMYNSRLLKAYSELDDRVRPLVLMVKEWAKARGVCGAGEANLSSYSWTIMTIYFMQISGMLPSLQLLGDGSLSVQDLDYWAFPREFNVMFLAPKDYRAQYPDATVAADTVEMSVAELFYGFIYFFAQEYTWGKEKVSILDPRRTEVTVYFTSTGSVRCHPKDNPPIHVEDPIEDRDLNVVLNRPDRVTALKEELRRTLQMLDNGSSLEDIMEKAAAASTNNWFAPRVPSRSSPRLPPLPTG